jgi:hypothetical protein
MSNQRFTCQNDSRVMPGAFPAALRPLGEDIQIAAVFPNGREIEFCAGGGKLGTVSGASGLVSRSWARSGGRASAHVAVGPPEFLVTMLATPGEKPVSFRHWQNRVQRAILPVLSRSDADFLDDLSPVKKEPAARDSCRDEIRIPQ